MRIRFQVLIGNLFFSLSYRKCGFGEEFVLVAGDQQFQLSCRTSGIIHNVTLRLVSNCCVQNSNSFFFSNFQVTGISRRRFYLKPVNRKVLLPHSTMLLSGIYLPPPPSSFIGIPVFVSIF